MHWSELTNPEKNWDQKSLKKSIDFKMQKISENLWLQKNNKISYG